MHEKDLEHSQHVDDTAQISDSNVSGIEVEEDSARLRKIKRKVDFRLSAVLALMYCVNQIDRTNLPMA